MWTSERNRRLASEEPAAELGAVTLGGDPAGVSLGGERRWITVYSPGGSRWRPTSGETGLVLTAGAAGESPCVLGTVQKDLELRPGEVRISGGESGVLLGREGLELTGQGSALVLKEDRAELTGALYINGESLRDIIKDVVRDLLG